MLLIIYLLLPKESTLYFVYWVAAGCRRAHGSAMKNANLYLKRNFDYYGTNLHNYYSSVDSELDKRRHVLGVLDAQGTGDCSLHCWRHIGSSHSGETRERRGDLWYVPDDNVLWIYSGLLFCSPFRWSLCSNQSNTCGPKKITTN